MSLGRIATNIEAQKAYHSLGKVNTEMSAVQLRLATGKKINSPEDDPAGYQLSRSLEKRERGLEVALQNVTNARSVLNIAEGAYQEVMDILQILKEKATQAADTAISQTQRNAIRDQVSALIAEIDDIVSQTTFNGENLINGDYDGKNFQTGEDASHTLAVTLGNSDSAALGISTLSFASQTDANTAITTLSDAIDDMSAFIQDVGEYGVRLASKETTLSVAYTNTDAVRSNVEDADLVKEQMDMMKLQILQQTAASAFTQANLAPQIVLQLFNQ